METIIKMVSEKTGISHEQAASAVSTVLNFLKDKLPPGIGDQLDGFVNGGGDIGGLDNLTDSIGGFFGKKDGI